MKQQIQHRKKGFSLIEVIVVSALIGLFFTGLFAGVQLMLNLLGHSKAEAGARSLIVSRIEYIRSLPYDSVGTVSGIPSGLLPQTSSTTLNGVAYTERILIQYLDRPEDGFAGADSNGITEDSKVVKVTYSWNIRGDSKILTMITDIVPPSIESTSGGGTLLINVFDASVQPVVGADIHVFNDTVATDTIDVHVSTNVNGIANFPGAPARSGYQITATKAGYSTDQTYSASTTNPSPNPPHVSVVAGAVSTVNFAIDLLSDLTLRTISTPVTGVFSDGFSSSASIASTTNTVVSGGSVVLTDVASVYQSAGTVFSTSTTPSSITSWESFDFNGTSTSETSYRVRLYTSSGTGTSTSYTLIPDADLSSNSIGFIEGPIDITALDSSTYPSLVLGGELTTSNTSLTPELYDWKLTHVVSESPISGLTFDINSNKTIGDNAGQPVLKYGNTVTTNGSGESALFGLEWDSYDIALDGNVTGYDIKEAYSPLPYSLSPGVAETLTLVMEPHAPYSLRVSVMDTLGAPIGGASVHVYNGGFDQTLETSIYGQVFFGPLSSSTDYALDVSAIGYDTDTQTNVSIIGTTESSVLLAVAGSGGGGGGSTSTPPSTFLAGYNKRVPVSISGASLFGDVTNFPVYIDLSDLSFSFFSDVQANGADIRVTSADGLTEVAREVVTINTGARTGEIHFKAPTLLLSTTSEFYIYYGNATATDYTASAVYGSQNVWSNSYLGVYHLEQSQAGTGNANVYVDATANNRDGDDYVAATGKLGKLGSGQEFDNANTDYITLPFQLLNGETDVTASMWFRSGNNTIHALVSGAHSGEGNEYLWWLRGDQNQVEFFSHGNPREEFDINNIYSNSWQYLTLIREDITNYARFYLNGVEDNQSPQADTVNALTIDAGGLIIGQDQDFVGGGFDSGQELDGYIDELRFSDVIRVGGWISNEYSNQNNPTGFYTIGSIEIE